MNDKLNSLSKLGLDRSSLKVVYESLTLIIEFRS